MTDSAPTPTPVPNPITIVTRAWSTKTKLIVWGLALLGLVIFLNDYFDTRAKLREQVAMTSTMNEVMRKMGDAMISGGQVSSATAVQAAAVTALGKQVTALEASQGASIRMVLTALGQIAQQVHAGAPVAVTPGKDGAFQDVNLVQTRTGPALTEVKLAYDPAATDANKRLNSTWTSYKENFVANVGEWQKKDKGYVAAITMHRDVFKANPDDPSGFTKVGTETIDLQNATAQYSQDAFVGLVGPPPRWNAILGLGHDMGSGKNALAGILGYQLTTNTSLHLGQVGNYTLIGGGYRFNLGNKEPACSVPHL